MGTICKQNKHIHIFHWRWNVQHVILVKGRLRNHSLTQCKPARTSDAVSPRCVEGSVQTNIPITIMWTRAREQLLPLLPRDTRSSTLPGLYKSPQSPLGEHGGSSTPGEWKDRAGVPPYLIPAYRNYLLLIPSVFNFIYFECSVIGCDCSLCRLFTFMSFVLKTFLVSKIPKISCEILLDMFALYCGLLTLSPL